MPVLLLDFDPPGFGEGMVAIPPPIHSSVDMSLSLRENINPRPDRPLDFPPPDGGGDC